jgi:cysteine desulfurase/selenocysteine lyase
VNGLPELSGGMMPPGSMAHDAGLIGRLANDLIRDAFALASDPHDPGRLSQLQGLNGIDTSRHRNLLMHPELRYRAEGGDGLPMRLPWPEVASIPTSIPDGGADFYFLQPEALVQPKTRQPDTVRPSVGQSVVAPPVIPVRPPAAAYDPYRVRADFPALNQRVHGRPLVWLDNAATTQKPRSVIDTVSAFYAHDNSNIHRGAHELAARATDAYEGARERVRSLIGAAATEEVVFVRGTTEAINLVAQSYGRQNVGPGDEVIVTELEHHSNIVPWQLLCQEKGAHLRVAPIDDRGEIRLEEYERLLGPRTKIVAVSQVSNALGTIPPVELMTRMAQVHGAVVVVDGAQGIPHLPVNVQALGADFYAFSGHKLYGPTGIGALWGRRPLLESMPPWQGGGQMIRHVDFTGSTYNDLPYKFEAGTPIIAGAVGLGAAIEYVCGLGLPAISAHEHALLEHGLVGLRSIPRVRLIGTAAARAGVLGFVIDGMESPTVGSALDAEGIAVRAGHHCAQPALRHFGLESSVRPSLGLYNTHDDIDRLVEAVQKISLRRGRA